MSIFANKRTGIIVTRENPSSSASITYNASTTNTVLTGLRFLEPVKGRQLTDLLSQNGLQQGQFYYVYFNINDDVNLLDYVYFNLNNIYKNIAYSAGTDSQRLQIKSLELFDAGIATRNKMAVCQSLN